MNPFVPASPSLQARALLPRTPQKAPPFPFDDPSLSYVYLARNGICALARLWQLAGCEILFPAYFHGVEVETLRAAGVLLRFYPVHAGMQVDVDEIRAAITPHTRGVYLIHYLGFPGPAEQVAELCRTRGLFFLEDCALALLSCIGHRPLGSFGDAAVFCLYKTLPVPNGGVLRVRGLRPDVLPKLDPPALASTMAYTATAIWRNLKLGGGPGRRLLKIARHWTKSRADALRIVQVGSDHFDPSQAGLAMSGLCRWIIAAQNFQNIVGIRRRNYEYLLTRLRDISPPVFSTLPAGVCPLFYPLRTRGKETLQKQLLERGVETVNFWAQPSAGPAPGEFPEVDALRQTILELPCHQDLDLNAMDRIATEVRGSWRNSMSAAAAGESAGQP